MSHAIVRQFKGIIRLVLSSIYLILIILCIPLAFDVGGTACGLSFSFTIFILYFVLTTIRLITGKNRHLKWLSVFYYVQHIVLPSILTLFLSYYRANTPNHILPIRIWRDFIVNSTPIFTILEGFCSLLLIQAIGQIMNWLTVYKSDSWLFVSLIGSGSTITAALYFLYRIYVFEFKIDTIAASLLGSILTTTVFIGLFGIISGKGSIIESSLLIAYIVRCIYETFPILSNDASKAFTLLFTQIEFRNEFPIIPPQLTDIVSQLVPLLASNIPGSFKTVWGFFIMAIQKLTLPVLLNLAYRIGVFYAATKIIPILSRDNSFYNNNNNSPPRSPIQPSRRSSTSSIPSVILSEITSEDVAKDKVTSVDDEPSSEIELKLQYEQNYDDNNKNNNIKNNNINNNNNHNNNNNNNNNKNNTDDDELTKDKAEETFTIESSENSQNLQNYNLISKQQPNKKPRQSTILKLIYSYSPCIVIAVYTHLMMSYSGELGTELKLWGFWEDHPLIVVHPWQFWNWVNMVTTLILYAAELMGNNGNQGSTALTSHWEVE